MEDPHCLLSTSHPGKRSMLEGGGRVTTLEGISFPRVPEIKKECLRWKRRMRMEMWVEIYHLSWGSQPNNIAGLADWERTSHCDWGKIETRMMALFNKHSLFDQIRSNVMMIWQCDSLTYHITHHTCHSERAILLDDGRHAGCVSQSVTRLVWWCLMSWYQWYRN